LLTGFCYLIFGEIRTYDSTAVFFAIKDAAKNCFQKQHNLKITKATSTLFMGQGKRNSLENITNDFNELIKSSNLH